MYSSSRCLGSSPIFFRGFWLIIEWIYFGSGRFDFFFVCLVPQKTLHAFFFFRRDFCGTRCRGVPNFQRGVFLWRREIFYRHFHPQGLAFDAIGDSRRAYSRLPYDSCLNIKHYFYPFIYLRWCYQHIPIYDSRVVPFVLVRLDCWVPRFLMYGQIFHNWLFILLLVDV